MKAQDKRKKKNGNPTHQDLSPGTLALESDTEPLVVLDLILSWHGQIRVYICKRVSGIRESRGSRPKEGNLPDLGGKKGEGKNHREVRSKTYLSF